MPLVRRSSRFPLAVCVHASRFVGAAALAGCLALGAGASSTSDPNPDAPPLHRATDRVAIGAALSPQDLDDPALAAHVAKHFAVLTPGNEMKPDALQREQGVFTFERADRLVAFAQAHGQDVIGHTLVWHSQAPKWLFEDENGDPLPRDIALDNMREHIHAVAGHFRGKVKGWDVVNEAISDGGPYLRDTPALRAIGEDYVIKAFQFAHEADPDAELYFNDYNIEREYKREKALRLVEELRDAGCRIDAVGIQGHWLLGAPGLEEIEAGVKLFIDAGFEVHITEMDVDPLPRRGRGGADVTAVEREGLDPYQDGLPPEVQQQLATRYAELFELFLRHPQITRVTFWGTDDGRSWLNYFPVRGRTNHPLLFDRELQPKPAFFEVVETLQDAR